MRALRMTGGGLLWVVAVLGALSGVLFLGHLAGWVQPLVVVSGSMQPEIRKGDLLIAVPVAVAEVDVGEVATLPSDLTGTLVTHRVTVVGRDGSDYLIEMAGDANKASDPQPYRVDAGATVLQPVLTVPAVGQVVLLLARPAVAIPLAVAVLALIALSLVPATSCTGSGEGRGSRVNAYRRFGVSALGALAAASLALGVGLALAPVASARAAPTPEFTLEFPGLVPGVPQTDSGTYTLERGADLVAFAWLEQSGVLAEDAVTIDIEACDSAGACVDPTTIARPVPFASGVGTVTVTVELTSEAENGETGAISGRLSFLADEVLAVTGADSAPWIAAGAAAIAVGVLGLALTRRREDSVDQAAV